MRPSSYMMNQRNTGVSGSSLAGGKRAISGPRHTNARASADTVCQKCGAKGHFLFECKNERPYVARPTRTQQLKNPRRNQELYGDQVQRERESQKNAAGDILKKNEKERKRARSPSTSGSDSTSASDSDSNATSGSDSSSGSDSDSEPEAEPVKDKKRDDAAQRRKKIKQGKQRQRDDRSVSPRQNRRRSGSKERLSRSPSPSSRQHEV